MSACLIAHSIVVRCFGSGGNNSGSIGNMRQGYVSGNIRVSGGGSNVVENVESSHSSNRGIWVQSQKLVVSGGSYHHNDADGIDIDSSSSHNMVYNASFYMNSSECGQRRCPEPDGFNGQCQGRTDGQH